MGYRSDAPNMQHVVEDAARKYPRAFDDCHRPERGARAWVFGHIVASILHYQYDRRWGRNGKRGNTGDPSMDAVSRLEPQSPAGGVAIFDIVSSAGETDPRKPQPAPAWIDQTQATVDHGTIGAWIKPLPLAEILAAENENPADPDAPEEPKGDIPAIPPRSGELAEVLRILHTFEGRLAAIEQHAQVSNGGVGQLAGQVNDLSTVLHTLIGNAVKRVFGQLVEENGVTHAGVAQEAAEKTVALLYEKNGEAGGALRVKLPSDLGGIFRRGDGGE
jgi:hypothetical protein